MHLLHMYVWEQVRVQRERKCLFPLHHQTIWLWMPTPKICSRTKYPSAVWCRAVPEPCSSIWKMSNPFICEWFQINSMAPYLRDEGRCIAWKCLLWLTCGILLKWCLWNGSQLWGGSSWVRTPLQGGGPGGQGSEQRLFHRSAFYLEGCDIWYHCVEKPLCASVSACHVLSFPWRIRSWKVWLAYSSAARQVKLALSGQRARDHPSTLCGFVGTTAAATRGHSSPCASPYGLHGEGSEHPLGQQLSVPAGMAVLPRRAVRGCSAKWGKGRSLDIKLINSLKSSKVWIFCSLTRSQCVLASRQRPLWLEVYFNSLSDRYFFTSVYSLMGCTFCLFSSQVVSCSLTHFVPEINKITIWQL